MTYTIEATDLKLCQEAASMLIKHYKRIKLIQFNHFKEFGFVEWYIVINH